MRARCLLLVPALLLTLVSLASLAPPCSAVPAWSRRYGIPCSSCHSFPSTQLTGLGVEFLHRGHRMEDDSVEKDFGKLLAAHAEWTHEVVQHQNTAFESPEFHFHAGGAVSRFVSVYVDANVNSDFEAVYGQFTRSVVHDGYVTARVGKMIPTILREYASGLMASASDPLVITDATLGMNPFTPTRDSFGFDVGGKWSALFVQAGVVNGEDVPDQARVGTHKDFFASAEVNVNGQPTGVGVYYFRGGYDLIVDTAGTLDFDRYERGAVFANLTRDRFRAAGAYLLGQDDITTQPEKPRISGIYAQVDVHPVEPLTPFARYDWVKTERIAEPATTRQGTVGLSAALYVTEATGGRISVEFSRRDDGTSTTNAGALTLMFAF